jgi:glycosyltransferase involved in cell wall biosynthesis
VNLIAEMKNPDESRRMVLDEEEILNHGHELSIIIPAYNEDRYLMKSYKRLTEVDFPVDVEIVLIDDGSTDKIMKDIKKHDKNVIICRNPQNMGKGASVRKDFELASGTIFTIHDADMEIIGTEKKILKRGFE